MSEQETIDLINKRFDLNLVLSKYEFNDYDAENENYIVEIKNRRKFYDDKIIECMKLFKNYHNAELKEKSFLYIVTDEEGVYIFNISKNISRIIESKIIKTLQPRNTDFDNNNKMVKYVYFLEKNLYTKISLK